MNSKWYVNRLYSTDCEITFIRRLGRVNYEGVSPSNVPRKVKLKRYLQSCKNRFDWDRINKETIVNFVKKELLKEAFLKQ